MLSNSQRNMKGSENDPTNRGAIGTTAVPNTGTGSTASGAVPAGFGRALAGADAALGLAGARPRRGRSARRARHLHADRPGDRPGRQRRVLERGQGNGQERASGSGPGGAGNARPIAASSLPVPPRSGSGERADRGLSTLPDRMGYPMEYLYG